MVMCSCSCQHLIVRHAMKSWLPKEIDAVIEEAKKGDYDHFLSTLMLYTK